VEVHYDALGNPRKAWVRSSLEVHLSTETPENRLSSAR
jgi:hypothetical protein